MMAFLEMKKLGFVFSEIWENPQSVQMRFLITACKTIRFSRGMFCAIWVKPGAAKFGRAVEGGRKSDATTAQMRVRTAMV
jgi:hypothetical protein